MQSTNAARSGGTLLMAVGALLLVLAVSLSAAERLGSPGTRIELAGPTDPAPAGSATSDVVAFWEERVRWDPADFTAHNRLASAYIQRARETGDVSDYTRAEAAVQASLASLSEGNQSALALLAAIRAVQHDFAAALDISEQALALDAGDPFAQATRGDALLALGRYDEAYDVYAGLVAASPSLSSFARMAHIYELRGDVDAAELAWRNALSVDSGTRPESTAWARAQFGGFYFRLGNLEDAADQYEASLISIPGYVHAAAGLARIEAAEGDYDTAVAIYSRVLARQPLPEYVAALGDVYTLAGRPAEAREQYQLVLAIDQLYKAKGINTDVFMAGFRADHNLELHEAVRQSIATYQEAPGVFTADTLAWALHQSGRSREAAVYAHEALSLGTQDAGLFFHAGMIERALGNNDRARHLLARALELNSRFSLLYADDAAAALAELEGA